MGESTGAVHLIRYIIGFVAFNPGPERTPRFAASRFTCGARVWFRKGGIWLRERWCMRMAFSPWAGTEPLWSYWKYNSKAERRCRRRFSPTAIGSRRETDLAYKWICH